MSSDSKLSLNANMYNLFFKRPMDFVLSLIAIIILFPVLIIVAILVRFKLGTPILFKQKRPGLNGKLFNMYKFRTMTNEKDENGELLQDSVRLTKFGKILRSTSLDELPELINILKGEMSFVGPRPQLVRDMVFMSDEEKKRHTVKPGLTGLAQICGRNNISWGEKFKSDLEYIANISFNKDFLIIVKTFIKVIKKDGIDTEGMDTAEDLCDYLLKTGVITKEEYETKNLEAKKLLNNER